MLPNSWEYLWMECNSFLIIYGQYRQQLSKFLSQGLLIICWCFYRLESVQPALWPLSACLLGQFLFLLLLLLVYFSKGLETRMTKPFKLNPVRINSLWESFRACLEVMDMIFEAWTISRDGGLFHLLYSLESLLCSRQRLPGGQVPQKWSFITIIRLVT